MNTAPDASRIPHSFPFDPTQGYDHAALQRVEPPGEEPSDFDAFWKDLRERTEKASLEPVWIEEPCGQDGFRLLRLTYGIGQNFRSAAWLTLPEDAESIRAGLVASHGYDGRASVEPGLYRPGFAVVLPVAPGFHISADPRLPHNEANRHVVHGIETPQTYVLGLCAAAIWKSLDAAQAVVGRELKRWHYCGWSFGGGMGALALPWEPRVQSAEIGQPTFGHHPLRLQQPSTGSSHAVRERFLRDPEILRTLAYFDAATAIQRLTIPVAFACALFDPAVTPPGQFAVANAHRGPKRISAFLTGHFEWSGPNLAEEMAAHRRAIAELIGPDFIIP